MGTCGTPRLKRKRRRRAEDKHNNIRNIAASEAQLTLDVVDARDQVSVSPPPYPKGLEGQRGIGCCMGRPIKHQQELGTEQSMELCCAGTRAKSSPLPRRPPLSTTHSRRHRDRRGLPRMERRDLNYPNPASSGGNKGIRCTSRVRHSAQADCLSTTSRWRQRHFLGRD